MSVWIPTIADYDSYFLNTLKTITVDLLGDGNRAPINVTYYMPEYQGNTDIDLLRPAIAFYRYDRVHDLKREQSYVTEIVDSTSTSITTRRIATPMKFYYQFIILTDYEEHMSDILTQFQKLFPFRGFITVVSPDGENVDYDFFQQGFQNADTYQKVPSGGETQERIFRSIFRYHLFSEVDESKEVIGVPVASNGVQTSVSNTNP